MTDFGAALWAEALKLRRTLALWMTAVAPLLVIVLQVAMMLRQPDAIRQSEDPWRMLITATAGLWSIFMLPLLVALEAALLCSMEHQAGTWKHLFALPVSKVAIYAAKGVMALLLVSVAGLGLGLGAAGAGRLVGVIVPGAFAEPVPWAEIGLALGPVHAAALLILAIHHWVSFRWRSTTLALGVGVVGVFFALFAAGSELGSVWPWLQPARTLADGGASRTPALLLGVGGGVVFAVASGWAAVRRDVE